MRMYYNDELHTVISYAIRNLRASRFWAKQAEEAQEVDAHNYYGIDYAKSKADELKSIAYALYSISKKMRNTNKQHKISLFNRAEELDWEAWKIDNR